MNNAVTPPDRTDLARLLDEARTRQHLSIRATARLAGVPATTVQGWLSGKHLPTPALRPQFEALVAALGLTDEVVLDWARLDPAIASLRTLDTPYVGLRPFSVADADVFHGRDAEVGRVARAVRDLPGGVGLLAVVGPSGSGKSSLLAAGLLGRACAPGGELAGRRAVVVRPDDLDVGEADLVVVDQFEDVLAVDDPGRRIAEVVALAADRAVVLGIRADAYGALSAHRGLAAALERPLLLAPMGEEEVREAIVGPARSRGVAVESGLVERLLHDPAPLPLLSNVLLLTWGVGQGHRMTLADHELAGGVASAVESLAEGVVHALDPALLPAARTLFLRLVRVGDGEVGTVAAPAASLSADERTVADAFAAARIVTLGRHDVRISHESLVRHWPRLAGWIDEGRADLALRERLRQATALWLDNERAPESLLPVDRLPLFGALAADPDREGLLTPDEQEFLAASRTHFGEVVAQERRTSGRLRRRGRAAFALAAVACVLAGVAATSAVQTARVQREAQSRQIATQAGSLRATDRNLQAQLALVAAEVGDTLEGRSALLGATGFDVPVRWPGVGSAVLAVSGDGRTVVRADGAGGLTLWESDRLDDSPGRRVAADPAGAPLFSLALADVGGRALAAVGGSLGFRQLWELGPEPRALADLPGGTVTTLAVAFDAGGTRLALGDSDGRIDVVSIADAAAPALLATATATGPVSGLAFHAPSGRLFASGALDGVASWTVSDAGLEPGPDLPLDVAQQVRTQSVAASPDGQWLVAGVAASSAARWRLAPDGAATWAGRLAGFDSFVNGVTFSADSATVAAASSDRGVHLFDTVTGEPLRTLQGPAITTAVGWAGERPVATGTDGTLWAWGAAARELRAGGAAVFQLGADAAGERWLAAAAGADQRLLLWDIADGMRALPSVAPPDGVLMTSAAVVSSDGSRLYSGTRTGEVITWDLGPGGATNARVQRAMPTGSIANIALHPGGRLVAASHYTGDTTVLLDQAVDGTLTPVATLATPTPQVGSFNADGTLFQIGIGANGVQLWDVRTPAEPRLLATVPVGSVPSSSAFAPRSPRLAVGEDSGDVTVWDVGDPATPVLRHRLTDGHASVYAVAFAPDESLLVAAGADEVVWGWDPADPASGPVFALDGRMGTTTEVRFLRGGAELAGASLTGGVRVWTPDLPAARAALCAGRGAALTDDEWERYLPGVDRLDPCT